jgi:hypothetical protein
MGSRRYIPIGTNCANGMSKRSATSIRTIVAVSYDIGGAQAVYPVVPKLRRNRHLRVNVIAGGFAQKVFTRLKPLNTETDWSDDEIDQYLDRTRPDLVLSSTSWKSCLEQGFRNRARLRNIPSVVVIDFWSDHPRRWHDATYRFEESTDWVCVPDPESAATMAAYGYPSHLVRVTGHPHLERCARKRTEPILNSDNKKEIAVLFLTISLAALKLKDDSVNQTRIVCQALGDLSRTTGRPVSLTIRPHPHENPPLNFLDTIQRLAPPGVTVHLADRTKPIMGQIQQSDFVLGHVTMGLFEARSLGKQAIALEVTNHPLDLVAAMKVAGIPFLPFDAGRIAAALSHPGSPVGPSTYSAHRGAATAIARFCCELINANVFKPSQALPNSTHNKG